MEFMSADLPTLGTPTSIIRRVGSFEIASFSFSSAKPRSWDQTIGLVRDRRGNLD